MSASENTDRRWRAWDPSTGFRVLARYVAPDELAAIDFDDVDTRAVVPRQSRAATDRVLVERLYARLVRQQVEYGRQPWRPDDPHQEIRDPVRLIARRVGNCLDFATTYAAMCLHEQVAPLLVVTVTGEDGHAFVVATPGRVAHSPAQLECGELAPDDSWAPPEAGVFRAADLAALRERLTSGDWLGVELSGVRGRDAASFEEAQRLCLDHLDGVAAAGGVVRLVDVAAIQVGRPPELPPLLPYVPPASAPIHRFASGPPARFDRYRAHEAIVAAIAGASGTVVLLGESGTGKSTIARQVASEAPGAWFLNASEPQALTNSLSQAETAERPSAVPPRELNDREGVAFQALDLLNGSREPWVVVVDNADVDPGRLRRLLPRPNPDRSAHVRQLVLVTTTDPRWERVEGFVVHRLPALDDAEAAEHLPGPELAPLTRGRPLLFDAFRRLAQATGWDGAAIAAHAPAVGVLPDELRGPATLWAAAQRAPGFDDAAAAATSALAAYLPPDRQPLDVLERLAPECGVRAVVELLARLGLVRLEAAGEADAAPVLAMHRLVGAAIRAELEASDPPPADAAMLKIATSAEGRALLDSDSDLATLGHLGDLAERRAKRTAAADRELGVALSGIAELYELHGHTQRSSDLYALAEPHLQDDPVLLAQSFHGRARSANQHYGKLPEEQQEPALREALGWARHAQALLRDTDRPQNADRSRAMEGLLMQHLAHFPHEGETTLGLLRDALDVIEEAHNRRSSRLGKRDPELARSEFNRAGIRVRLAQEEPHLASDHLLRAQRVYDTVGELRRGIYGRDQHPHVAACTIGLAYVEYFRALLIPSAREERTRLLRNATSLTLDALSVREAQEGSLDGDEAVKCLQFLAKVALARDAVPLAQRVPAEGAWDAPQARRVLRARAEIADARYMLASTPPLPSHPRDARAGVDAWARSAAIADLVAAFAPDERPPRGADLAQLLAWLEDFSTRWDFRNGRERNLVVDQQLDEPTRTLIEAAAHGLGLVGTVPPPADRYDHVLILGGLIRACLARPLHAARLLREQGLSARAVTALGGYRELKGDELELAARFGMRELTDELGAMDAGVRAAFGVAEPISERGEASDRVGASWRVIEYAGPGGVSLRVAAAPSREPGTRRANTPDAYEWFAAELAQLRRGQRVLVVTTDIYVPYQHADALRMLALPHGVEVDAVGIRPGDVDPRLAQEFKPHNYLQEIRSTIRAFGALHAATTTAQA